MHTQAAAASSPLAARDAAPDLLAALKAVLQDWRADIMLGGVKFEAAEDRMACREGYEQARAAIAKATGAA